MKKIILFAFIFGTFVTHSQQNELNLMPWPQKVEQTNSKFIINKNFTISVNNLNSTRINIASTKFLRRLASRTGVFLKNGFALERSAIKNPSVEIIYNRIGDLKIHEDESYTLQVNNDKITIKATTDIGAIYGLETLLQLVSNNETSYFFNSVHIEDEPRFTWRGLMIDVARHFEPVQVLKRNLDAMASVKMNVFHWHLTDDQGIRIESKTHPKLHELGSDGLYYTQHQIKDVIKYAGDRGIRVVPEIDVPGHATAFVAVYPELGSKDTIYAIERNSGIFHATLDPTKERTYEVLADLFGEMAELFPDEYFHIGGDENEGKQWDETEHIIAFKKQHNLKTNHDLQTHFNIRLQKVLEKHGKKVMGWEEIMTNEMPTTALIHSWRGANEGMAGGSSLIKAAKKGHNTVLSNGYYLDLMQPIKYHYLVDPLPANHGLTEIEKNRILGAEATMWSELVTQVNIDSRIWPRMAAIAERYWSSASVNDLESMYKRMEVTSQRLEELGITHIRNKAVILRNITNHQSIESLETLSKICEPLKIYTRNAGGTEYQTYSPFTLFVDACNVDAADSFGFNKAVKAFSISKNSESKKAVIHYLNKWINGATSFNLLEKSPILNDIAPLYNRISTASKHLKKLLNQNNVSEAEIIQLQSLIKQLEEPVVDVEFAIVNDLKKLASML